MVSFAAVIFFLFHLLIIVSHSTILTVVNKCTYVIWPALFSDYAETYTTTGFAAFQPGESETVLMPTGGSGFLWGRTLCSQDLAGKFYCVTGDCGSSTTVKECGNRKPMGPAIQVAFKLNSGGSGRDIFYVSLEKGFNIPVRVEPVAVDGSGVVGGSCKATGCLEDLNRVCPTELRLIRDGATVGCNRPHCTSSNDTCVYHQQFFKRECPRACVNPSTDDGTWNSTCFSANYLVTFCPKISSLAESKNSGGDGKRSTLSGSAIATIVLIVILVGGSISCTIYFKRENCGIKITGHGGPRSAVVGMANLQA